MKHTIVDDIFKKFFKGSEANIRIQATHGFTLRKTFIFLIFYTTLAIIPIHLIDKYIYPLKLSTFITYWEVLSALVIVAFTYFYISKRVDYIFRDFKLFTNDRSLIKIKSYADLNVYLMLHYIWKKNKRPLESNDFKLLKDSIDSKTNFLYSIKPLGTYAMFFYSAVISITVTLLDNVIDSFKEAAPYSLAIVLLIFIIILIFKLINRFSTSDEVDFKKYKKMSLLLNNCELTHYNLKNKYGKNYADNLTIINSCYRNYLKINSKKNKHYLFNTKIVIF